MADSKKPKQVNLARKRPGAKPTSGPDLGRGLQGGKSVKQGTSTKYNPYSKAKKGETSAQRQTRTKKMYSFQRTHAEETGDQQTSDKINKKLGRKSQSVDSNAINKAIMAAVPMIAMGVARMVPAVLKNMGGAGAAGGGAAGAGAAMPRGLPNPTMGRPALPGGTGPAPAPGGPMPMRPPQQLQPGQPPNPGMQRAANPQAVQRMAQQPAGGRPGMAQRPAGPMAQRPPVALQRPPRSSTPTSTKTAPKKATSMSSRGTSSGGKSKAVSKSKQTSTKKTSK